MNPAKELRVSMEKWFTNARIRILETNWKNSERKIRQTISTL